MRAREFLNEVAQLEPIKDKIIDRVKATNSRDLLEKIYSYLSKSDLDKRLMSALQDPVTKQMIKHDKDLRLHLKDLSRVIAEVPGPYDEKVAFLNGLGKGYIDTDLLLSGRLVTFRNLLTSKDSEVPMYMIERIFLALEKFGTGVTAKGPGEYALAVMSPDIEISGKGDIKIGNRIIEVKSSGGRLGTTGDLKTQKIPEILIKYLTPEGLSELKGQDSAGLTLNRFANGIDMILKKYKPSENTQVIKDQLVEELVNYIFSNSEVRSVNRLKAALKAPSGSPRQALVRKLYALASYDFYQGPDRQNFEGILLINFSSRELQYFTNPREMYKASTLPTVSLISGSERNILSPVTLRTTKKPSVKLPRKSENPSLDQLQSTIRNFAEKIISQSDETISTKLVNDLSAFIKDELWDKGIRTEPRIKQQVVAKFPYLAPTPQVPVTTQVSKPIGQEPVDQL